MHAANCWVRWVQPTVQCSSERDWVVGVGSTGSQSKPYVYEAGRTKQLVTSCSYCYPTLLSRFPQEATNAAAVPLQTGRYTESHQTDGVQATSCRGMRDRPSQVSAVVRCTWCEGLSGRAHSEVSRVVHAQTMYATMDGQLAVVYACNS